jgi:hypothetical protein
LTLEKIGCLLLKIFIHMNNGETHLSHSYKKLTSQSLTFAVTEDRGCF